jgi:copper(I)-binding protein
VTPLRGRLALAAAAGMLALAGCSATGSSAPQLKVSGAYIPQPVLADMAAGYFTVTNTGGTDAKLTSVTSSFAGDITMHTTKSDQMLQVNAFTVPADGKLTLSLGGNHLMLMDLKRKPVVGDKVSLELHFAKGAPIDVQVPVKPPTYRPEG